MNTTKIEVIGAIANSRIISDGYTILNPSKIPMTVSGDEVVIISRVKGDIKCLIKAYDGDITDSVGNSFTVVDESTIEGVVVKTYSVDLSPGWYPDENDNMLGYKIIHTTNNAPFRIDIPKGFDFAIRGNMASNYNCPYYIDSEQVRCTDFCQSSKYVYISHSRGTINTRWFKGNNNLVRLYLMGRRNNVKGDLMDFAECLNLRLCNFFYSLEFNGDIRSFLNAHKAAGARNKTLEIRINNTSIKNDVTPSYSPIYAVFDSEGNWTASNSQ